MLAGDIDVRFSNGQLVLTGDSSDNQVLVQQVSYHTVSVMGDGGTTINGQSAQTFYGAIEDVELRFTRGGDNTVIVYGVTVDEDINARMGRGNDNIALVNCTVAEDVFVSAGAGNDSIFVGGAGSAATVVHEDVTINTQSGDDFVVMRLASVTEDVRINTSIGNDGVQLDDSRLKEDVFVVTGSGDDVVAISNVVVSEVLSLNSGVGNDDVVFHRVSALNRPSRVITGGGNDSFAADDLSTDRMSLMTGGGDDVVYLNNYPMGTLQANLGGGNDGLLLYSNDLNGSSNWFIGGGGHDEFVRQAGGATGARTFSFETPAFPTDWFGIGATALARLGNRIDDLGGDSNTIGDHLPLPS